MIFDDIHWAEPTLLDLIEHVADWSRDAPILLLCMARPDLLDDRPGWGGGKMNATTILLEPLPATAGELLLANLLGSTELDPGARERILAAAGGNPLFVEEMLDMLVDRGHLARADGGWIATSDLAAIDVPAHDLGAARRATRPLAAHRSARSWNTARSRATCSTEAPCGARASTRRARDAIAASPDGPRPQGTDPSRPRRDPRRRRVPLPAPADPRRGVSGDAEGGPSRPPRALRTHGWRPSHRFAEVDEIVGYHLEQAHTYLMELGPTDERTDRLAEAAADHLVAAGRRARERGDDPAAVNLLSRASSLLPRGTPKHVDALCEFARTVAWAGDIARSEVLALELRGLLEVLEDPVWQAHASIALAWVASNMETYWDPNEWLDTAESAIEVFERVDDELGLARAYDLLGWGENA